MRSLHHPPCAKLGLSTPRNMIYRDSHRDDRNDKTKKQHLGCLAHADIGIFYSVVANPRQP